MECERSGMKHVFIRFIFIYFSTIIIWIPGWRERSERSEWSEMNGKCGLISLNYKWSAWIKRKKTHESMNEKWTETGMIPWPGFVP